MNLRKKIIAITAAVLAILIVAVWLLLGGSSSPATPTPSLATKEAKSPPAAEIVAESPVSALLPLNADGGDGAALPENSRVADRQTPAPVVNALRSTAVPTPEEEPTGEPPAVSDATPEIARAEMLATARMIAAHAPLRAPEVIDPDSAYNRRILQTMVSKAIARAAVSPARGAGK